MSVESKIKELREQLNHLNHQYYVENAPEVSDFEYDALMRSLQELETAHPEFDDENSPTRRVGSDLTNAFRSVQHAYPMLSLSNTYSEQELRDWIEKSCAETGEQIALCCELKFDGTAISLTYENDRLLRAVTRGDGTQGDDVTENVRTIGAVPLVLRSPSGIDSFEVRGEIYMTQTTFERLNREREAAGEQLFANPRNAAAGTLKLQQSKIVAKRELQFTAYQIEGRNLPFNSHSESMERLRECGFPVSAAARRCTSEQQVIDFITEWDKRRAEITEPIDGVVIKVDSYSTRRALGRTSKAPKWAVAYKFKAEQALTKLESVTFQVGRTGAITPVANLSPVHLAGTTVKRATLHNADQIEALDLRIGDMVYVEKGGEIIPKVTGVELSQRAADSTPLQYITHCPECGSELVRYEGEAKHYCPNQSGCRPQILGRIEHFVGRKAMNIEGLGAETIKLLFDKNQINNIADLYKLNPVQLTSIPRLDRLAIKKIIQNLRLSKDQPFDKVLFALGIRFVGEVIAKNIASHFNNIDDLIAAKRDDLIVIEDVGDNIADSILEYFSDKNNIEIINRLKAADIQLGIIENACNINDKHKVNKLNGASFVVTGSFFNYSRDEIKDIIENNGGKFMSSISSKTNYLLAGEKVGSTKTKKAKELGVTVLTEDEFFTMVGIDQTETKNNTENIIQGTLF